MRALHRVYSPLFAAGAALRRARVRRRAGARTRRGRHVRLPVARAASSCRTSRRATSGSARRCRCPSRSSSRAKYVGRMRSILRGCVAPRRRGAMPRHPASREREPAVRRRAPQAPRGAHGRLAARATRRRHGRSGLPEHRALRAAQAVRRVAPRLDQGEADRRAVARAERGVPGRRLQLLADDQRQRRGGRLRRQGRELGQGVRQRPRARTRRTRRPSSRSCRRCPASRTSACSARWGSRASSSRPTASRARATA